MKAFVYAFLYVNAVLLGAVFYLIWLESKRGH